MTSSFTIVRLTRALAPWLLLLLWVLPLQAGTPLADGTLTMREAFAHALEQNPDYRSSLLERDRLLARRTGALGWEAPEVSYLREGLGGGVAAPGEERWTLTQEVPSLAAVSKRRGSLRLMLDAAG